jgi:hypothetical protein
LSGGAKIRDGSVFRNIYVPPINREKGEKDTETEKVEKGPFYRFRNKILPG